MPVLVGTSGWQYRDWRAACTHTGWPRPAGWSTSPTGSPPSSPTTPSADPQGRPGGPRPDPARLPTRGAALCLADSPHRQTPVWRTADWTYLRLHEGTADPRPCYDRQALAALAALAGRLADLVGPDADAYVYFNNDPGGCTVRDAVWFAEVATSAGLHPTRVPSPDEAPV